MSTTAPAPTRIIVAGGRHWGHTTAQRAIIRAALSAAIGHLATQRTWTPGQVIVLVHGACTGTDTTAAAIATQLGWDTDPHPIDWNHQRATRPHTWRQAGPERNTAMCAKGADLALIFPGNEGTAHCAAAAAAHHIPVVHIPDHPRNPPTHPPTITLTCRPYPPALAAYTTQLGMPLIDGPRSLPGGATTATVDAGGLHITLTDAPTEPSPPGPGPRLTLTCQDPQALQRTLAHRGLTPTPGPRQLATDRTHHRPTAHYTMPGGLNLTICAPREDQQPCR